MAAAWTAEELLAREVLVYTNEIRVNNGLLPLKIQSDLEAAAQWFSEDMAAGNFLSHIDSLGRDPGQRIPAFGYTGGTYGENVARGFQTPQQVVDAWMGSTGHRANILRSAFRELGVGYTETNANPHRWYWVQNFGARAGIYPVVVALDAFTTTQSTVTVHVHGEGWAEDMRLSNDGIHWSAWEPYDPEVTWDLEAGTGARTVIAEIRRGALVKSHSDTIEVEGAGGTPPASPSPTDPVATSTTVPASATPTATRTATPTASPTSSPTSPPPTATETPTPSATATATIVASETPTAPIATATLTESPEPTLTGTSAATATATGPTPTATMATATTATVTTATVTATLGITSTATVTNTATATESTPGTPAAVDTDTPTATHTPAPSDTPTATSTPVPASPTPSHTATSPPTHTVEPTDTRGSVGTIYLPIAFTFRR